MDQRVSQCKEGRKIKIKFLFLTKNRRHLFLWKWVKFQWGRGRAWPGKCVVTQRKALHYCEVQWHFSCLNAQRLVQLAGCQSMQSSQKLSLSWLGKWAGKQQFHATWWCCFKYCMRSILWRSSSRVTVLSLLSRVPMKSWEESSLIQRFLGCWTNLMINQSSLIYIIYFIEITVQIRSTKQLQCLSVKVYGLLQHAKEMHL